jgi:hypothetical protein
MSAIAVYPGTPSYVEEFRQSLAGRRSCSSPRPRPRTAVNLRAAEAPYLQIAAGLRTRILAGEFRPGLDPLPSEAELVQAFGVARDTARGAVRVLAAEGLVVTVPQRGSYVLAQH